MRFLGNWSMLGLRGTGSVDFEVPEHWVHRDFTIDLTTPVPRRGGALYRMGFMAFSCLSHGAFALGAARRMLDEWKAFARTKSRSPGLTISDTHTFQRDIAAAHADLRSAEAWMKATYAALYDAAQADAVTPDLRLEGKLSCSHAYAMAMRVASAAMASAGQLGLRDGSVMQRCFRDIVAGNAHVLTGEQSWIECGRVIGGVDGASVYF